MPRSWLESCRTSSIRIRRVSSVFEVTVHSTAPSSVAPSRRVHGGDIQFSGLYEPPSEWTSTEPSALIISTRVAIGRCAVSRPA